MGRDRRDHAARDPGRRSTIASTASSARCPSRRSRCSLAALFAVATELLTKREPRPGLPSAAAIFATGSIAALALALTLALEQGWLTVALALMVPGTAWVERARPLPWLRTLCAILAGIVVLRIGAEPRIVADVGTTPIFNWILYGYGVPAISFWVAGALLRRRADDTPTRVVESAAILLTVLTGFLEIRHYIHARHLLSMSTSLTEAALQVCGALAMAIGLERIRARTGSVVHDVAAQLIAALALFGIVFHLLLFENPWLNRTDVGGLFINLNLLGYRHSGGARGRARADDAADPSADLPHRCGGRRGGARARLSVAAGRALLPGPAPRHGADQRRGGLHLLGGVARLRRAAARDRRRPALAAGAALLGGGGDRHGRQVVFLLYTADLTGVWRALAVIGLGLVLVGIGYMYQRLLFVKQRPQAPPPAVETSPI